MDSKEFLSIAYFFNAGFSRVASNFYSWQCYCNIWFSQFYKCLFFTWLPLKWSRYSRAKRILALSSGGLGVVLFCENKGASSITLFCFVLAVLVKALISLSFKWERFLTPAVKDNLFVERISILRSIPSVAPSFWLSSL